MAYPERCTISEERERQWKREHSNRLKQAQENAASLLFPTSLGDYLGYMSAQGEVSSRYRLASVQGVYAGPEHLNVARDEAILLISQQVKSLEAKVVVDLKHSHSTYEHGSSYSIWGTAIIPIRPKLGER